jgi:DNA-binding MarR family transcriptional regulator
MPAVTRTDTELSSTLRVSVMRLARRLRRERPDHGLGLTQLAALGTLERCGPMTPRALAEHEKVQPPSMTRTLASLESQGLVERNPHPTDGRQFIVEITADGRGLMKEDRRRRDAWLAKTIAEHTTAEERAVLRAAAPLLDRLAQA